MQEFVGRRETGEWVVTSEMLAVKQGSGTARVLATPSLIASMENVCMRLVQPALAEGITTVGTRVAVSHLAPTPEGARIRVTAELLETDGRRFVFRVEAADPCGKIGEGTMERQSVRLAGFEEKAAGRTGK